AGAARGRGPGQQVRRAPRAAVRRAAAARGDRAGAGHGPRGHAVRRGHLRPRPRAGQGRPRRHDRAGGAGHDHGRGHPRDGLRPRGRGPAGLHGRRRDRRGRSAQGRLPQPPQRAAAGLLGAGPVTRYTPAGPSVSLVRSRPVRAVVSLVLAVLTAVLVAGPAAAQDGGDALQGTLRGAEREPVAGVEGTVTTPDGGEVGSATSDDAGEWVVEVPEAGTYTVTLNPDTLPEDVTLREEGGETLEGISVRPGRPRTVIFQ